MRSAGFKSAELSNRHLAKPLRFVFNFSFLKAKPKVWRFPLIAPNFQFTTKPVLRISVVMQRFSYFLFVDISNIP